METLKQTLIVPESHHIKLDITLPDTFPAGEAEVVLIFAPKIASSQNKKEMLSIIGKLKKSSNFGGDPIKQQEILRNEWKR